MRNLSKLQWHRNIDYAVSIASKTPPKTTPNLTKIDVNLNLRFSDTWKSEKYSKCIGNSYLNFFRRGTGKSVSIVKRFFKFVFWNFLWTSRWAVHACDPVRGREASTLRSVKRFKTWSKSLSKKTISETSQSKNAATRRRFEFLIAHFWRKPSVFVRSLSRLALSPFNDLNWN